MYKYLFLVILCVSLNAFAAFSEKESTQLSKINHDSNVKVYKIQRKTKQLVDQVLADFPEMGKELNDMYLAWGNFVSKKCQFDSFESLGKDAEIAMVNDCKIKEYSEFNQYLSDRLSMP